MEVSRYKIYWTLNPEPFITPFNGSQNKSIKWIKAIYKLAKAEKYASSPTFTLSK